MTKSTQTLTLQEGQLQSLRQQCKHRLDHRLRLLSAKEVRFLEDMWRLLARKNTFSVRQLNWLIAILDRTRHAQTK